MNLKNNLKILFGFASLAFLAACSPKGVSGGATVNGQLDPNILTSPIDIADAIPSCEVDIPQIKLGGNVNAFEFTGSVGVTFGYNPGGLDIPVTGGSVNLQISKADMDFSMVGSDPMTGTVQVSTEVGAGQTTTTINAQIDFSQFQVTPQFYFQTPLAAVSAKGLALGVSGIKSQTDAMPWVGRVLKHLDGSQILINAGTLAGVRVGDLFNVFNVTHYWSGQPCQSTYFGSTVNSKNPDATLKIIMTGDTVSVGVLTASSETGDIHRGAEVLVGTLVPDPGGADRYLKKEVSLGKITAENFTLPGGGSFDFQGAMNSQILDVLNQSGAYIFKAN